MTKVDVHSSADQLGQPTRRRRFRVAGLLLGVVLVLCGAALIAIPSTRWRVQVVALAATGQIPDLEWSYLFSFLLPSSPQSLSRLIETHNPYPVIRNPMNSRADIEAGYRLFIAKCSTCHAPDGRGGSAAPALFGREFKHGASDWAMFRTIRYGVPGTGMAPFSFAKNEIWQLVAYIGSLEAPGDSPAPSLAAKASPVSYDELRGIREPADDWLTYSGSYSSARHSALKSINPDNVDRLAVRWIHQFQSGPSPVETSPVVRQGVMFVTSLDNVTALDARDGKVVWNYYRKTPPTALSGEFSTANRGVAILDDKIFVGTLDAHLIALSARTGSVSWDIPVADHKVGFYITSAPLAFRDLVVTGVSTKTIGRGFIAAYDAKTGKERWRFSTVPEPGQPGSDTWTGDSWRNGGAPTWLTGSYDSDDDVLYWGVGNPKPDYDAEARRGDNLYSNSVVALRGSTGQLVWHFQFTPADNHDWDANQVPVLADYKTGKHMLWANRNGFYYVLDRMSGAFLGATPFARQTWADGIDKKGRPILHVEASEGNKGILIYPSTAGATNWWSPSFDAELDRLFIPVLEAGTVYFPTSVRSWPRDRGMSSYTAVRALNASTGKLDWEYRHEPRVVEGALGGLLSTNSGLLFGGDEKTFFALDSKKGNLLWSFRTGGNISAAPVTYTSNGEQFVAVAAGSDLLTFALPKSSQIINGGIERKPAEHLRLQANAGSARRP